MTPARFAQLLEGPVHDHQDIDFEGSDGAKYVLAVRVDHLKRRHVPDEGPDFEIERITKGGQEVDKGQLDQGTLHDMEMHVHQELHKGIRQPSEYEPPVG